MSWTLALDVCDLRQRRQYTSACVMPPDGRALHRTGPADARGSEGSQVAADCGRLFAKAFHGELVPKNPDADTASV